MATWLTHLRISDRIADHLNIHNYPLFFAGSIAPDNIFSPDCSHWCTNGDKKTCAANRFYDDFILHCPNEDEVDFYLGYYVHLCADVIWQKEKLFPLLREGKDIRKIKAEWKKADNQFLLENKLFRPFIELKKADNLEKRWLSYMEIGTVKNLVNGILNFTAKSNEIASVFAAQEIQQFIADCSNKIIGEMSDNRWLPGSCTLPLRNAF